MSRLPLEELTALPRPANWTKGREGEGNEARGGREGKGKGGKGGVTAKGPVFPQLPL